MLKCVEAEIANYEACLKEEVEKRKKFKVSLLMDHFHCWLSSLKLPSMATLMTNTGRVVQLRAVQSICRSMTRGEPTTTTSSSVPSSPCWPRKVSRGSRVGSRARAPGSAGASTTVLRGACCALSYAPASVLPALSPLCCAQWLLAAWPAQCLCCLFPCRHAGEPRGAEHLRPQAAGGQHWPSAQAEEAGPAETLPSIQSQAAVASGLRLRGARPRGSGQQHLDRCYPLPEEEGPQREAFG